MLTNFKKCDLERMISVMVDFLPFPSNFSFVGIYDGLGRKVTSDFLPSGSGLTYNYQRLLSVLISDPGATSLKIGLNDNDFCFIIDERPAHFRFQIVEDVPELFDRLSST